jgi:hypothetical protein
MIPSVTTIPKIGVTTGKPQPGAENQRLGATGIRALLGKADRFLEWAGANRTREMLVEDFGGFGVLRTLMDSLRGFFFGAGGLNIPAASERLAREGFSILTDNVLAGVSAAGFGKIADKRLGAYSNKWTDFPTLELFQQTIQNDITAGVRKEAAEQRFLQSLARQLSQSAPTQEKACLEVLQSYWKNPTQDTAELSAKLARKLGIQSFDVKIGKNVFRLDNLLDDIRLFKEQMNRLPAGNSWAETAQKTLASTLKVKNYKLGFVGLGMAATFAVPYVLNRTTRHVFGIDYYTGEIGLKQNDKKAGASSPAIQAPGNTAPTSPFFTQAPAFNQFAASPMASPAEEKQKHPSYVRDSWNKGNPWPFLIALLPAPLAAGLFDTVNWKGLKPFSKAWRNALDFSKSAPFTTQQQMAATFALLIISRLMAARSDNEFRERLVDSGLGWGLWILGTPALKRAIAGYLDRKNGQNLLLKEVPLESGKTRKTLRTAAEVEKLAAYMDNVSPEMLAKAQKQLKLLSRGSLLGSLFLLGIVEPFIAIQWTKFNSRKRDAQAQPPAPAAPQPGWTPTLNRPATPQAAFFSA